MALRITIDVFSGRPNPVLVLEGKEAAEALARLRPARKLDKEELKPIPDWTLGYRGLIIEQEERLARELPQRFRLAHGDLVGPRLAHRATDEHFEDFVCGSTGLIRRLPLGSEFPKILRTEIEQFWTLRSEYKAQRPIGPKVTPCMCGPLNEPNWWNDGGQRQFTNNCYNYAANYRTDTYAQPGRAAGAMFGALTCASVRAAAEKDALVNQPGANNKCPEEGHLVALVIWPGVDFNWYRKDRNGYWTHKHPGRVTNLDNNGRIISDPRTASRAPYTDFCTFMVVMHGHIKLH
jgi:hypothetical protein